jgi:hypothetical protein
VRGPCDVIRRIEAPGISGDIWVAIKLVARRCWHFFWWVVLAAMGVMLMIIAVWGMVDLIRHLAR